MSDRRDKLDEALREAFGVAQHMTPPEPAPEDVEDDALLRLLDNGLDTPEASKLQQRINRSPWCRERLETLTQALQDVEAGPVESSWASAEPEQSRVKLAFVWAQEQLRYLWGTLEPRSLVAEPVAIRGAAAAGAQEETSFFDFTHRFDDVDVVIQVERIPDQRLDIQLTFAGAPERLNHLRVTLADRRGGMLDSQPVEHGTARFSALMPLPHQIQITHAQQELGRVLLDVHNA